MSLITGAKNKDLDFLFNGRTWGLNLGNKIAVLKEHTDRGYWFLTINDIGGCFADEMKRPTSRILIEFILQKNNLLQNISEWMEINDVQQLKLIPDDLPLANPTAKDGVYFIRAGGFVKIGYSNDIRNRIESFRCGCPHDIELVATIIGATMDDEFALHGKFSELRARGEWFRDINPLSSFILSLQE